MSDEKDVEAMAGTDEEKQALRDAETADEANDSRARMISGDQKSERSEVFVDVNGQATVDSPDTFVGLSKDELMKYADDPYWKKVRLVMLILFWVGWCAMLVAAIIIIVVAPKCPPRPKLDWWQKASIYQLVVPSFMDSDSDGIGDFKGLHNQLDYLQGEEDSLNVSALLLNPIHPHGGMNNFYDATDFKAIAPELGTMEDFENFRVALHKRNMQLVLSFLPHHTSNQHEWFEKSRNKEGQYADYYVWHAGKNGGADPPNNWQCRVGGSAWTKDDVRGEYYLGQFDSTRPDLNYRSADLQNEIDDVLRFWMEKGVDGFNAEGVPMLVECANFTDEELKDPNGELTYNNMVHSCTLWQPESYEVMTKFRKVIDDYAKKEDKVIFFLANNQGSDNQTAQLYEYNGEPGVHMAGARNLLDVGTDCRAKCVYDKIHSWLQMAEPREIWSNWRLGDSHHTRVVTRYNKERNMINALNLLVMTLPGTNFPYYGEEIGMRDLDIDDLKPENKRYEVVQTPLQWSAEANAGFTDGNDTWIPIPDDYTHVNIKTQRAHGKGVTNLEVFQNFIKVREEPSMQWGDTDIGVAGNVLFYVRQAEGFPGFLVAINLGPTSSTVDFVTNAPDKAIIPEKAVVFANTANFENAGGDFDEGQEADLTNLYLEPDQGVVFKWEKDAV